MNHEKTLEQAAELEKLERVWIISLFLIIFGGAVGFL